MYELDYKTDSTSLFKDNEKLILLLDNNKNSFFQSYNQFKRDSINNSEAPIISSFISETVNTNNTEKKIFINKNFENINTFYTENIPKLWVLKNTVSEVNGIKCKEASLYAYGRSWTACYSEDYPFQFGPYFFAGLPGLIISIKDSQNFFSFRLISLKKENNSVNANHKVTEVSKENFYQMIYDTDFSGNAVEKNFSFFPAEEKEKMKKKYVESAKKKNNLPIDKSMRYIFDK